MYIFYIQYCSLYPVLYCIVLCPLVIKPLREVLLRDSDKVFCVKI